MNAKTQAAAVKKHGEDLLAIFPMATERDPVQLCRKLRRLEREGAALGLRLCNGPEFAGGYDEADDIAADLLRRVNALLGNVSTCRPLTGAACGCRPGRERDNCQRCEGTGNVIDFQAIRSAPLLVPVFVNRDPRGYALKIDDQWVMEARIAGRPVGAKGCCISMDFGGYGILAPDLTT